MKTICQVIIPSPFTPNPTLSTKIDKFSFVQLTHPTIARDRSNETRRNFYPPAYLPNLIN